jgi:hypothetical protein
VKSRGRIVNGWISRTERAGRRAAAVLGILLLACARTAHPQPLSEYQLKAAFLYNFALFTDWPAGTGSPLTLCIYGADPFGKQIDALQDKPVGERVLDVRRTPAGGSLADCQIVFIAPSAITGLTHVLDELHGQTALTVADSPDAARHGVALNMSVAQDKVSFEANLTAARGAGLNLSSKLLRLATQVIQ